nr:uncharacterized protein LOC111427506 [Onthophagus taurus]
MFRQTTVVLVLALSGYVLGNTARSGEELVSTVVTNCADMGCVKQEVLGYLDNLLNIQSESARDMKNVDAAIFKRAARVLNTHEIRYRMPEMIFGKMDMIYNPKTGLDLESSDDQSRGLLKKKLLFPALLLLKLKMKALMPIILAIVKFKAIKALILSKLAIAIVLGFVIYQLVSKSGMPMPMSMTPMAPPEPPMPVYGAPMTSTPSSYEPGWEPSGGPYARIWNGNSASENGAQNMAYSAYYPGSSTTIRP